MTKKISSATILDFLTEYLVFIAIVVLVIVTAIVEPRFLSAQNFTNLMRQFGPLSLIALGMTFIIIGGFIDLSIPGMMAVVAMGSLSLFDVIGEAPAMLVGLALGMLMGCINGLVLVLSGAMTQAKALFITFGMSQIYGAIAQMYTSGAPIDRTFIDHPMPITLALGRGNVGPLSTSFIVFLFFLAALFVFQKKTLLGRSVNYTGGNIVAAELGGIPTKKIVILIYILCGFMTAVGTIVLFSRVPVAVPLLGVNFERDAIMAVVVGGTTLLGGKGSVMRTVLGVSLVVLLSNCMNLLGVETNLQEVLRGAILVTAIWLDHRRHNKA